MEPWTDGAPLILESELPLTRDLRVPRMEPWTDGEPLIFKSELPLARELRGCSLGLMGCP